MVMDLFFALYNFYDFTATLHFFRPAAAQNKSDQQDSLYHCAAMFGRTYPCPVGQ